MIRLSQLKAPMPPAGALEDDEVLALIDTYNRLFAQARDAQDSATASERKATQAREADVDRYAQALRDAKPDPGKGPVEKAEAALEKAKRHADATARATLAARDELAALVSAKRDELAATAEGRAADARAGLREAVDALEAAHGRLGSELAGGAWARGFPDYKKGGAPNRLPGLRGPNGDEYFLDAAIAAMRELG